MGAAFGKIVDLIVEFTGLASQVANIGFTEAGDNGDSGAGIGPFELCPHGEGGTFAVGPQGLAIFPPGPGQEQLNGEGYLPLTNGDHVLYENDKGAVISGVTFRLQGCTALTPVPVVTSVPVVLTVISEVGKTGTENHGTTLSPRQANTAWEPSAHLISQTGGSSTVMVIAPSPTTLPTTMVTKHVTAITALAPTIHQKRSSPGTTLPTSDQDSAFVKGYLACLMAFFAILGIVMWIGYCIMKRRQKKRQRTRVVPQEGRVEMLYGNDSYAGID